MGSVTNLIFIFTFQLFHIHSSFLSARATQIEIQNKCSYTVWAAADARGGKKLNQGETWTLTNLTGSGRIWGRTNCKFDGEGRRKCESGDCDGLLECKTRGRAPNTVAEYALNLAGYDHINISVVEGFNIPMEFCPRDSNSEDSCRGVSKCAAEINDACPMELRDPGGCNNPCTVFNNNQFCCTLGNTICKPTTYSKFFKDLCPYATTYPSEEQRRVCPTGTDYELVFCPSNDNNSVPNDTFFEIQNNCSYKVWAAALPGGGRRLDPKQKWLFSIKMAAASRGGRIWGRTNCNFDNAGRGKCQTGDCGGVLECENYSEPPITLAEYTMNALTNRLDYFDISLVDGFNIPMEIGPAKSESRCTERIRCAGDINGDYPNDLKTPGGCNSACTVYNTDQYCCRGANITACGPTVYSLFFKDRCPDAYSYPFDDKTSTFVCPSGDSYQVLFCP